MVPKRFLFLNRHPPHNGGYAAEMLDIALIAASFDQQVHLAFLDDGVFQLVRGQRPDAIGRRDFAAQFFDLAEYDIDQVWVERESLDERGLSEEALMIPATVVPRTELVALMSEADVVIGG
jgi:tRNA 2-thiouridine synthesizing protein C